MSEAKLAVTLAGEAHQAMSEALALAQLLADGAESRDWTDDQEGDAGEGAAGQGEAVGEGAAGEGDQEGKDEAGKGAADQEGGEGAAGEGTAGGEAVNGTERQLVEIYARRAALSRLRWPA